MFSKLAFCFSICIVFPEEVGDAPKWGDVDSLRTRTFEVIVEFKDMGISHRDAQTCAQAICDDVTSMASGAKHKLRSIKDYLFDRGESIF